MNRRTFLRTCVGGLAAVVAAPVAVCAVARPTISEIMARYPLDDEAIALLTEERPSNLDLLMPMNPENCTWSGIFDRYNKKDTVLRDWVDGLCKHPML